MERWTVNSYMCRVGMSRDFEGWVVRYLIVTVRELTATNSKIISDAPLSLQALEVKFAADRLAFTKALALREESAQAARRAAMEEADDLRDARDALAQRLKMTEAQVARLRRPEVRAAVSYRARFSQCCSSDCCVRLTGCLEGYGRADPSAVVGWCS